MKVSGRAYTVPARPEIITAKRTTLTTEYWEIGLAECPRANRREFWDGFDFENVFNVKTVSPLKLAPFYTGGKTRGIFGECVSGMIFKRSFSGSSGREINPQIRRLFFQPGPIFQKWFCSRQAFFWRFKWEMFSRRLSDRNARGLIRAVQPENVREILASAFDTTPVSRFLKGAPNFFRGNPHGAETAWRLRIGSNCQLLCNCELFPNSSELFHNSRLPAFFQK